MTGPTSTGSSSNLNLSIRMKATIALLAVWLITLVIEVPFGANMIVQQQGLVAAVGPVIIESVFVILIVLFIVFGRRGRAWSYTGAMVIGILHTILSAAIYFRPGGPPLVVGAWLTAIPALVALAGAASFLELRKQTSKPTSASNVSPSTTN